MFTIKQRIDLQAVNPMRIYEQPLEYGNKRAHEWTVEIISGGKPAELDGMQATVTWIRQAGPQEVKENPALLSVCMTIPAEIAGNRVRCVLDGGCYGGIGPAVGKMQLSKDGELTAAALMAARIEKNSADAIIDPAHIVPSVEALLEKIGAMDESTKATLEAAKKANTAAGAANTAAGKANEAAGAANSAAGKANKAAQTASEAAGAASGAAGRAAEAAGVANTAAGAANEAAGEARQAAGAVGTAIETANAAAGKANKAAAEIRDAQTAAEQAVQDAQTAVQDAQAAVQTAEAWSGATATAETIPYGQPPTVTVADGTDGRVLHVQVPEGPPGPVGPEAKPKPWSTLSRYKNITNDDLNNVWAGYTFTAQADGFVILSASIDLREIDPSNVVYLRVAKQKQREEQSASGFGRYAGVSVCAPVVVKKGDVVKVEYFMSQKTGTNQYMHAAFHASAASQDMDVTLTEGVEQ